MSTARLTLSALWCDQGMAHMVQSFPTLDAVVADHIALVDFGAETMFKKTNLKLSQAAPAVTKVVEALLQQQEAGLTPTLDYVIVTHQDMDHWSLLNSLMDAVDELEIPMRVGRIVYGGADWGAGAKKTIDRLEEYGVNHKAPRTYLFNSTSNYADANGTIGQIGTLGDVALRVLMADAAISKSSSSAMKKNGTSAVIVIDYANERMILPGDATWETLQAANNVLNKWTTSPVQPVKVISAPHHGSLSTMTPSNDGVDSDLTQLKAFTELVRPDAVIASAGYSNSFKHPYLLILKVLGKYAGSNGLGKHSVVVYSINDSDWVRYDNVTKNIYTTVLGLTSPVPVADYHFTRNKLGFFTDASGFYGPSKGLISVPSTSFSVLSTAIQEEDDSDEEMQGTTTSVNPFDPSFPAAVIPSPSHQLLSTPPGGGRPAAYRQPTRRVMANRPNRPTAS